MVVSGILAIYMDIILEKEIGIKEKEVPDILEIVRFHLSQEALNNMIKHSRADHVKLSVRNNGVQDNVDDQR